MKNMIIVYSAEYAHFFFTVRTNLIMTVGDLKRRLASKLNTSDSNVLVSKDSNELSDDSMVLSHHGLHENVILRIDFRSPVRCRPEVKTTTMVNFNLVESHGQRNALSGKPSL